MKSRLAKGALFIVLFALAVFVVFPLLFGPSVSDPTPFFPANPFALEVKISNENMTPVNDLQYRCEAENVELANGTKVSDAAVVNQGSLPKFEGRKAIRARCETAYIFNTPLKSAEFKFTVKYKSFPWPQERTDVYRFVAEIDHSGQVTKWVKK